MEADTGATAADVVAALRELGLVVTAEDIARHWDTYRALARVFNVGIANGEVAGGLARSPVRKAVVAKGGS